MNKRGRSQIIQIATGRNHVLALDTQGNVYSWGTNMRGQCGAPEGVEMIERPKIVSGDLLQHEVCQIYAGETHSFAVTKQGKVFCWGNNKHNLLGLDLQTNDSSKK